MANAADIIVNLIAKTGRFNRGLRKSGKQLTSTKRAALQFTTAIRIAGAALIAFAAVRLSGVARETLQLASALERVSETVTFSVTSIQQLRFAADQLDLTQQTLDLGLQRFSRRVAEAAQGQGELLKVTQKYNVVLLDSEGNLRPNIAILKDFANVIATVEDEQEQLRIAFKLFDSEGAALVRLLRKGGRGFDDMAAKAKELGIIMSDALVSKAAAADRQIRALETQLRTKLLITVADNIDALRTMAEVLGSVANAAVKVFAFLPAVAKGFKIGVRGIAERVAELVKGTDNGLERVRERIEEIEAILKITRLSPKIREALEAELAGSQAVITQFFAEVAARSRVMNASIRESLRLSLEAGTAEAKALSGELNLINIEDILLKRRRFMVDRLRLQTLIDATITREARILSNIRFIQGLIVQGDGDINQLLAVRKGLFEDLQDSISSQLDGVTALTQVGVQAARNLQDAFRDFALGATKGFKNLGREFVLLLRRMVAELLARKLLLSFLGLLAGGSGGLAKFATGVLKGIPKRHSGGDVAAGRPVITGGPGAEELFIPKRSGRIIPRGKFGGLTLLIEQNNNFYNTGAVTPEGLIPLLEGASQRLKAEIFDELDRGAHA